MDSPKVSVIIPAYNVRQYIRDAINSLRHQSYSRFEAIIVDDGSTDDTAEVVRLVCEQDTRFRLLQKQNGGLSSARNHGIHHARTEYIALLDADDVYHPDKLLCHLAVLEASTSVGVVYSASRILRDDGELTWMQLSGKPISTDPLRSLLCKNFIGHGSNAVFRREIVDEVGFFDETLRSSEDLDFWLRIAATQHWQFYRLSAPLSFYRVRPTGLSFNVQQMQACHLRVLEAAYQRSPELVAPVLPTARAYLYRYLARIALTADDSAQAHQLMKQAWTEDASIFWQDPRSLLTMLAVQLAPIAQPVLRRVLDRDRSKSPA